jgi:hypothetical protein
MYSTVPVCGSVSDPHGFYADPVGMLNADPDGSPAHRKCKGAYTYKQGCGTGKFEDGCGADIFLNMILALVSESNFYK